MSKLDLLLEAERRGILPDDKKELLAEARRRGLVPGDKQPSIEIDAADRAYRRGRAQLGFGGGGGGLLDWPLDAYTAGANVALGRDEGRGFSGEFTRQRAKTATALHNDELNLPDVAADTAGQTLGAIATLPLTASRKVSEMGMGAFEAGRNALMRNLAPRSEETLAANLAAKDMTRRQLIGESARVGGAFGVAGGYSSSPDDATTGDILANMAEHGAGGAALGTILPPIVEAGVKTINWGKNRLFRPSVAAADRANAAAADAAATGGQEFAPELGGPITQGTASGLSGTVLGGPLRAGARQSLDALHESVQRELAAAGGTGTPAEVGERAQQFLRRTVEGRSRPEEDVNAMNPLELHGISGVPPAPGVDVPAPRVAPVQPRDVGRVHPNDVIEEAVANAPPVPPKPVTDLESRYKPPTPEEVELAPEMVNKVQKAGAEVADQQRRLDAETGHAQAQEKALLDQMAAGGYREVLPVGRTLHVLDDRGLIAFRVNDQGGIIHGGRSPEDAELARKLADWFVNYRPEVTASIAKTQKALEAAKREHDIVQREMEAFRVQELPKLAEQRRAEALADATKANEAEASVATQKAREGARAKASADAINEANRRTQTARDAEAARAQQATEARQRASDEAHQADLRAAQDRMGEPLTVGSHTREHSYRTEFDAGYAQYRNNAPQVRMNPLGARPPVYRAPPQPPRGAKYSPTEIEDAVAALEASRDAPGMPETLTNFMIKQGGIKDTGGEARHVIGGAKGRPGLINNKKGRTLDELGEAAQQAGFFHERPTVAELLDHLDNDMRGMSPVVRMQDQEGLQALRDHQQTMQELERVGIAGAKTADEARQIMSSQLGPRPQRQREMLAPIRPADEIHSTADLLDRFASEAPMGALKYKRGNLFDESGAVNPDVLAYLRPRLGKRVTDQLEHLSNLRAGPGQQFAPGLDKLHRLHTDIGREIRDIRNSRRGGNQPRSESDTMLSRLYSALDDDIQAMTRAGGRQGEVALAQRDQIDNAYSNFLNNIETPLKRIYPESTDAAKAFQELVSATQNGSTKSDTLQAFYRVLRDKGDQTQGTAWLLNDMTRGGVEGFLRAYRNISPDARQLMQQGAPDLMRFLDAAARRGGRLERFIGPASEGSGIDLSRAMRPGNIAIGSIGYLLGLPGIVAETAGGAALSKLLASPWYAGWLKSYPVARQPWNQEVQRHMQRFSALATETLGLNGEAAKDFKDALGPSKAKAGPLSGRSASIHKSEVPVDEDVDPAHSSGSGWIDRLPRIGEAQSEEGLRNSLWGPRPDYKSRDDNSFKPEMNGNPGYPHPTQGDQGFRQKISASGEAKKKVEVGPTPEERGFLAPLVKPRGSSEYELGVPGIIKGPYDAATRLFSNEGRYRPGTEDEEGVKAAFEAAGATGSGGLASRPAGSLGTFVGRVGAANLAKAGRPTAARALEMARDMEARGATSEQIRARTNALIEADDPKLGGVHQGMDGAWRVEISDHEAKLLRPGSGPAEDLYDHPELYAAYPSARNVETSIVGKTRPTGIYEREPPAARVEAPNMGEAKSILLHELGGHHVQSREGFPGGASLRGGMDRYRRDSGEAEARNVQFREDFTPEERRALPPELTEDVPRGRQIVNVESNGPSEARPYNFERDKDIIEAFRGGESPTAIAERMGVGRMTVHRALKGASIPVERKPPAPKPPKERVRKAWDEELLDKAKEMVMLGKSYGEIADSLGVGAGPLEDALHKRDLTRKALGAERLAPVGRGRPPEAPLDRNAMTLEKQVRADEERMLGQRASKKEVAGFLKKKYGFDVDPADIGTRNVWWRVGEKNDLVPNRINEDIDWDRIPAR